MLNRIILALIGIILSFAAARAQPAPAAAVGYNLKTLGPSLVLGKTPDPVTSYPQFINGANVVPYTFTGTSWTNIGVVQNPDGSVTMDGTGQAFGNGITTAAAGNANQTTDWHSFTGTAFGGGAYFQAVMKDTTGGPMSFWANDIETMNGVSVNGGPYQWPGQAAGFGDWAEVDFAEFDDPNSYGLAFHNWYGAVGSAIQANSNFAKALPSPTPDYTQYNTYGALWVPATPTAQGRMVYYFHPGDCSVSCVGAYTVIGTLTWNKYNAALGPPPTPTGTTTGGGSTFSVLDNLHLAVIFGGSSGHTTTVKDVQVWQATNQGNLVNGLTPPPPTSTKVPVPAPLTGSVTTQTWVQFNQPFSGITLACGKPFHFILLPPPQYNPTSYLYPLYIWLHSDGSGNENYIGQQANGQPNNPFKMAALEAGSYNTVPWLTRYPAFYVAPSADQTNGNGTTGSCTAGFDSAIKNWGGWTHVGSVPGSGSLYTGDTGPNTFAIIEMVKYLQTQYSIDPNRIYINGWSLGGIYTDYACLHYNAYTGDKGRYFAACAGMGGVNQADTPPNGAEITAMQTVPQWMFSGANDGQSPPGNWNSPLCTALGGNIGALTGITSATANRCGTSQMRYTLAPTVGHSNVDASGQPIWTNQTINDFIFAQSATGGVVPPPTETITVATIPTQASATAFTVSGTIGGVTTAPTLQYQVNGGTWLPLPASTGNRDPYNQPGSNVSVYNTPFGSGAIWSNQYHDAICYVAPVTTGACTGFINPPNNFGITNYTSTSASDPTFSFSGPNGRTLGVDSSGTLSATMHVPTGAFIPGPYPGDNQFLLQDKTGFPNRQYTWGGILPLVPPPGLQAGNGPFTSAGAEWDDITSDTYGQDYDTGISGYNLGAGLITGCDVNPACNPFFPQIKHGLRFMLPPTNFASNAPLPPPSNVLNATGWPDRLEDFQSGPGLYSGTLPFGYTLGIPASTPMPAGLDANCQGLFWTMQHYPSIPRDVSGGGFHYSMDQTAVQSGYYTSVSACLPTLVNLLQVLTNQHQGGQSFVTNPANGPGTRIDTGPLPLSGGVTSVTPTSYFFTVPGMAAGASNTIAVRDAASIATLGTSNAFVVTGSSGAVVGAALSPGYVSTSGNQFRDGTGTNERLSCTNYSSPTANMASDMTLIRAQAFNCITVPWFDKITCPAGTCGFSAFDTMVSAANAGGLRVVFVHQGNEGSNGSGSCMTQQANGLWYDLNGAAPWNATNGTDGCGTAGTVTYAAFKANWLQFATHYAGNTTVIGFDLHNEPTTFGNAACCTTGGGGSGGTGTFQVTNGQIIDPNGNTFHAAGVNIYWNNTTMAQLCPTSACTKLRSLFPNINFVRIVWQYGYTQSATGSSMEPYITYLTNLGIVVAICDFNNGPGTAPVSGTTLTNSINWYRGLATTYKNNPYVWYEAQNEMYGPGATMASNHQQLYDAVRSQTATGIVFLGFPGGGNPGTVGTSGQVNGSFMTPSVYLAMRNMVWDLHYYAWIVNSKAPGYSTDLNVIKTILSGNIPQAYGVFAAQTLRSADGLVPVIVGEFGNSTTGLTLDPDGSQLVTATYQMPAVTTGGIAGTAGGAVYAVGTFAIGVTCCNALTDSSSNILSPYGVQVANLIAANPAPTPPSGVIGANWGGANGADMKAMVQDVGTAINTANIGALILVEGVLNNGTLFNGATRGSAALPITSGSVGDLSTIGTNPATCCAGKVGYVVHDMPAGLSGVQPDSGSGSVAMRNTAWGYLVTQNRAPVMVGKMGASLDNTNGALAGETSWATTLTQYMNGQLGAIGGPTFAGCVQPMSGDWFSYGNLAGQQPDGTLNANNSNKAGQQTYWSTLLYTTCSSGGGGGGGIGGTTWNPNDKSSGMVLSNGNLTATDTITQNSHSVRSSTAQSAGKVYFEITATQSSTDFAAGIANSTFPLTISSGLGAEGNGIGFYNVSPTQAIYFNGAALSNGVTAGATGDIIYFAADLDSKKLWVSSPVMRGASTPWNNAAIGSQNPATGLGGLSFTGLTCPCYIIYNNEEAGGAATINAGGPFNGTVPSGFAAFQPPVTSGGRVLLLNFAN